MELILASASPRRKELLEQIGLSFRIIPAKGEEKITKKLPHEVVMELSAQKAMEVAKLQTEDCLVLGADTIVAVGEEILGKPKDEQDALRMLMLLQGRKHEVYTGVTLYETGREKINSFYEKTEVYMYPMTEEELVEYIKTGEPMDKAGAYGIQGKGALLVQSIEGDYWNVVGFPASKFEKMLRQEFSIFIMGGQ